ncbi:protein IMPAIRED IN BABA-INDUCED STERILITY 1-like isoform X2 [Carex rostrata]
MGCFVSKHEHHGKHGQIWKPKCIAPTGETTSMAKEATSFTSNEAKENVIDKSNKKESESDMRKSVETATGTDGTVVGSSMSSRSFRLRNLHKYLEGEQVAAGWPPWLSAVAGEAIQGWVPLKADNFEKLEKVGQGTYSSVFRARDLESGKIVALKKVRFDNFEPESVRFMAREIQILRRLNHPNIMKLEGLIASRLSCSLYLVFEYMEHDLAGLSSDPDIKFTESQVKCYMHQLLSGLEHCHSRGIIHRDIKGANLLVNNEGVLKMADFGLANFYDPKDKPQLTSRVVTLWYRPPELLLGSTTYDVSVDLWSVGCVFAEIFHGKPILTGRTEIEQLHKIFKLCGSPPEEYWKKSKLPHATIFKPHHPYRSSLQETLNKVPGNAFSLLETLLSVEPYKRGTASSALSSEYFKTEPYACEPSSLPKYTPNKELDAKIREDSSRRKSGVVRLRFQDSSKRQSRQNRAAREATDAAKVQDRPHEELRSKPRQETRRKLNGQNTRLHVDLKPLPELVPEHIQSLRRFGGTHHMFDSENDQQDGAFSGPLIVASNNFAWAKKPRAERRPISRDELIRNEDYNKREDKNMNDLKEQCNDGLKRGFLKKWSQLDRPESCESFDAYFQEGTSARSSTETEQGPSERMEFSGPMSLQPHLIDDLLKKHERHIRQAFRKSWFKRGKKQASNGDK